MAYWHCRLDDEVEFYFLIPWCLEPSLLTQKGTTMNWTKLNHIALISGGLLAAFAGVAYQGSLANTNVTPTMTFGLLASLVMVMWSRISVVIGKANDGDVSTAQKIWHALVGVAGMVAPILVMLSSHFAPGSKYAIVAGFLSTFLGDLTKTGDVQILNSLQKISILVLAATLLWPFTARSAEPTPSDESPPISFCFGTSFNCVVPDFNLNTVAYDLGTKQWKAGVTTVAVGYMFLYASDQPWSSGCALHAAGQWSQGQPSYFALVPSLVIAKYFELGMSFIFLNGSIEKDMVLGLSANAENLVGLVTGKGIKQRYEARRQSYQQEQMRLVAKADEDERAARIIREGK
jgi:hypothetical protein